MVEDMMLHPQEHDQLFNDEMPSPLNEQILNFCESELFSEIQNSDVASSSNGGCYDEQSSYSTNTTTTNFDLNKFQNTSEKKDETITKPDVNCNNNNNNDNNNSMSMLFDIQDHDIVASIDFTPPVNFTIPDHFLQEQQQEEQFDVNPLSNPVIPLSQPHVISLLGPPLGHVYEDESLSSLPPYMRHTSASSSSSASSASAFLDPNMVNYFNNTMINSSEASAIFAAATNSALLFGSQLTNQELDFQGENGRFFCNDSLPRIYNTDLQALSNESQHLINGAGCSNTLGTEITSFEDPTSNRTGRCSVEARKEKIHRYMKKRNERNFTKKIKYACRKTLADSRPRVRGRFARNDEFGHETSKTNSCGTIEEEDTISHDEDAMLNSHISNMYHPNMITSSTHHANNNNGTIFTSNCHVSTNNNGPYDMCTPLYCTDGHQMH